MIKSHFKWKNLVIDITWMDEKYKKQWNKIIFSLLYGTEYIWNNWWESYQLQSKKEIEYSWETEIVLELDEIKSWYRGLSIFVWYYLEVDFWKKFLLFKDNKNIDISWRDVEVFHYNDLKSNDTKFANEKDTYSFKKILKNLSLLRLVFLLFFLIVFLLSFWFTFLSNWHYEIIWFISLLIFAVIFFTSWRWYFKWSLRKGIKDWDDLKWIIKWKVSVDLEEVKVQLFAYNSEKWNYEVNSGSTTRTVYFNTQVWNIFLYEKIIKDIKPWENLEDYIEWNIDFTEVYKHLFPEIIITSWMWLFLNIELRIISKNFKDLSFKEEVSLENNKFIRIPWQVVKKTLDNDKNEENDWDDFNSDFFA